MGKYGNVFCIVNKISSSSSSTLIVEELCMVVVIILYCSWMVLLFCSGPCARQLLSQRLDERSGVRRLD